MYDDIKEFIKTYGTLILILWFASIIYSQYKNLEIKESIIIEITNKNKDLSNQNNNLHNIIKEQDSYSIMLENKINYYEEWNKVLKDLSQHF